MSERDKELESLKVCTRETLIEMYRQARGDAERLQVNNQKLRWRLSNLKEDIRAALKKLEEPHE